MQYMASFNVIFVMAFLAGTLLGACVALLFSYRKNQKLKTEAEVLRARLDVEQKRLEVLKTDSDRNVENLKSEYQQRLQTEKEDWARISAESRAAEEKRFNEAFQAQRLQFDETLEKVKEQMKNAADEMLKSRQKEFSESSNKSIGQILDPLKEIIVKMEDQMKSTTISHTRIGAEMKAGLENMMKLSEEARKSSDELANVLKHKSKVQGDWGETVLAELLGSQGLKAGVHFDVQECVRNADGSLVKTEAGSMLRPDVILHLDERREVIIDSKVSLTAFMNYVNAEDEQSRKKYLKEHVDSIKAHVKELSVKDYSSYIQPPKVRMDYVIMFVPHSGALWTALNEDTSLWRDAMEQNVFIADEQSLYAALRIIRMTWTQIAQARNHQQVYQLANEMIERVGQFMKHYRAVGKALGTAQEAYEAADKKLRPEGRSILQTCAKLTKLGAGNAGRKALPELVDIDEADVIADATDAIADADSALADAATSADAGVEADTDTLTEASEQTESKN